MLFNSFNNNFNYKHLKINFKKIIEFSNNFDNFFIPDWSEEVFYNGDFKNTVNFIFLINTINFSFWSDKNQPKWFNLYNSNKYTGSFGLFSALNKAINDGYELFNPKYLTTITKNELSNILEKYEKMPMSDERYNILKEVGQNLLDNQLQSFFDIYDLSKNSSISLINNILKVFPSFADSYIYDGINYNFLKRAQLIPAMIYAKFQNNKLFYDIDLLTVFADYRVPQTLRKLGLIEYNYELSQKIQNNIYLLAGSSEEIEIRISCIQVANMIKEIISKKKYINSLHIDYFLWKKGKEILVPDYDFHRTRTIYY